MRGVLFSLPLHGHMNPVLPVIGELTSRGHEIIVYATEPFRPAIEAVGGSYRQYASAFLNDMSGVPGTLNEMPWLLARTTAEFFDAHLPELRALRADFAMTDSFAPWGQWAGALLKVPVVTSVSTFAFNRHVMAYAARTGIKPKGVKHVATKLTAIVKALRLYRRLSRAQRVKAPSLARIAFGRSALNVVYTSRTFQPLEATFDGSYEFVGSSLGVRVASSEMPWDQLDRRRLVYVSLGTLFNTDAAFYRACAQALGPLDADIVMSIGATLTPGDIGVVPPNVLIRARVPQLEVLSRASAFITHGGMNSVSESLYHGVPVVVVPQMSEQQIVAFRVEELQAGIQIAKDQVAPDRLRAAVERLLADDTFRHRASAIGASLKASGGAARAASAILTFLQRAPEETRC